MFSLVSNRYERALDDRHQQQAVYAWGEIFGDDMAAPPP